LLSSGKEGGRFVVFAQNGRTLNCLSVSSIHALQLTQLFYFNTCAAQLDTHADSVRIGPARQQHQHTDCVYCHHTD